MLELSERSQGKEIITITMKPILAAVSLLVASTLTSQAAVSAWINEFHYDDVGASDSDEFVEVAIPSSYSASDLVNFKVDLYNGSGSQSYDFQSLSGFTVGSSANGYTLYYFTFDDIQNGSPDGLALSYQNVLIHSLSYEGSFVGNGGPGHNALFADIGVSEDGDSDTSSLGLTGPGSQYSDFDWVNFGTRTPGQFNLNQTINPVPEPAEWGLICALGLMGICGLHNWRQRRRAERHTSSVS